MRCAFVPLVHAVVNAPDHELPLCDERIYAVCNDMQCRPSLCMWQLHQRVVRNKLDFYLDARITETHIN